MTRFAGFVGQAVVYLLVAVFIGFFATRPAYVHHPPEMAEIVLTFAHGADRKEACRRLTPQEIAELPPNERRPNDCTRERLPVLLVIELDDRPLIDAELAPTGLSGDGPSRIYRKFEVAAGEHRIAARLRDSNRSAGYDYETTKLVDLAPGRRLAIDFTPNSGGFVFH